MIELGVDVGNGDVKDSTGLQFESGYTQFANEPVDMSRCYWMNGSYYSFGNRLPVDMDKTESDRMWLVTIPSILNSCKAEGKTENVRLGVGIPISHFGADKEKYRDYYMGKGHNPVKVRYQGKDICFKIADVQVFPQGVAVYMANYTDLKDFDYLIGMDIGMYTVDVTMVIENRVIPANCFSIDYGIIKLITAIRDRLFAMNIRLPDRMICNTIKKGTIRHQDSELIIPVITDEVDRYICTLLPLLKERNVDLRIPVFTMCGGSDLIKRELEQNLDCVAHYGRFANAEAYLKIMKQRK